MTQNRDALNKGAPIDLRPECAECFRLKFGGMCEKYAYPWWASTSSEGICAVFLNKTKTRKI